jgi:hypothetical protein
MSLPSLTFVTATRESSDSVSMFWSWSAAGITGGGERTD